MVMENPEKIQNPDFLREKYKLHTEPEVKAATLRTQQRTGKKLSIDTKENANDSIQNYLDRLENVFNPPQLEGHPDFDRQQRNLAMLKESLHDWFVIKPEQVPEAYFNAIKRKHREEGHGDIEIPQDYRLELAQNLIDDQVKSLDNWVDYLSSDDAKYPDWLKYFAFRNVVRMGVYDKQKKSFGERTGGVTSPFPDLNREALAITLEAFERQAAGQPPKFGYDIQDDTRKKFNQFLNNKNFAKLYALAIEEFKPISEELLKITAGEWRTYPSGSDPKTLVESLAPYGTGWCIRGEGMAEHYLVRDKNTLQVFYSLDQGGKATVPRIVIVVNANNQLTEVRGVAPEENLDEYIGPVVQEKLKEFPDGQLFEKKNQDMKTLTGIDNKVKQGQELNKDELTFLYELNSPIEGFGYQRDPRIEELRKGRNTEEDMLTIFECTPEQIAHSAGEINENTRAYLGTWDMEIFQTIRQYPNIKHLYESFPDKKIFMQTLETDPNVNSPQKAEDCKGKVKMS